MSSGLETSRDFQVGLKMAWHKTTRVTPLVTANDFPEIVAAPLSYGTGVRWAGMNIPISADDGLPVGGAYGVSYALFTPRDAMAYLCEILSGTGYQVESLGMIFDRSRWFVTFDLTELAGIAPAGEAFKLSASGGLDKSQSPKINLTHTVQVCANTVQITRSGRSLFSSKLTKNFSSRLEASRESIGELVGMARIFNETLRGLENKPVTVDQARSVYAAELAQIGDLKSTRTQNTLDLLIAGFQSGRGNAGQTRLDVLNGYTEVMGQGLVGSTSKRDLFSRWESSEYGGNSERKSAFFEAITAQPLGWESMLSAGALALSDARRGTVVVA